MNGESGKVIVVQPRFGRVCWCSGRTRGSGAGMSGGRVSCGTWGCICACGFFWSDVRFERNLETMFEMEKWWSDDFGGSVVAMAVGVYVLEYVIDPGRDNQQCLRICRNVLEEVER